MDKDIISTATISYFKREKRDSFPCYAYNSYNEKIELIDKLFEYYEILGADSYAQYEDGSLFWRISQTWYTSEQIDRMMKLKTFS